MLGKQVNGSTMFGHEQQLFPLLSMMRRCWKKCPTTTRKLANKPICDIEDDFHQQMGVKFHKVLANTRRYSSQQKFEQFALQFINTLLAQYDGYEQVVCKSPENLSPESFDVAIDVLSGQPGFNLVYLFREFGPYLASCHKKFGDNLEYYAKKYVDWHHHAIEKRLLVKSTNLYVLDYNDMVADPSIIGQFASIRKPNPKIRPNTVDKWKQSEATEQIADLASRYDAEIAWISEFIKCDKIMADNS